MPNDFDTSAFPLGSTDPRVLYNNAGNEDLAVNDVSNEYWIDRPPFNRRRKTLYGMEQDFLRVLARVGYETTHLIYIYGQSLQVDRPTQLIDYNGATYRIKLPATFPVMLSGTWATDAPLLTEVADSNFIAAIQGPEGDTIVGSTRPDGSVTTVGVRLDLVEQGTVYADDPRFGGDIVAAAAAVGDNTVFVIRQPYTLTSPLRFVGRTGVAVVCVGAGKLNGSRTAFTFPTANARGILHFDNCISPVSYRVNILGARTARSSFGADVKADGDAGIEYYQCISPRTIECKVDQVLTWGVIHVGCTDTKTIDCTLTNMTRQSGVGHATVNGGLVRGCFVNYSGLYGIEVEGPGNTDIHVHNNTVRNCLSGIALIADLKSCEVKNNSVSLCTYLIQANANGASNSQAGIEISDNRLYDGFFHLYFADTSFLDVMGNSSLGRVAGAYLPQRPADHVVGVLSSTQVLILDSTAGTISVGDNHFYSEGVLRTVQAVTTQTDPTYGSCWLVTYETPNTSIGFGSFFLRNTSFVNAGAWIILLGTRNNGINIAQNTVNGPVAYGLNLGGNANALRWIDNVMVGVNVAYFAADTAPITNSSISVRRGDIQAPGVALFGGNFTQKIFPNLTGEIRTLNMLSTTARPSNNPLLVNTSGLSHAFRLKLGLVGSTKTANTGDASVIIDGVTVATIPKASLGGADILIDVACSSLSSTHKINLADTFGDMGFQSATFELHTVEV